MTDDPKPTTPDFDDDLSDLIGGKVRREPLARAPEGFVPALDREFVESCPACHGSGFWRGIRSRPCFKCKGEGKRVFKSSPAARAKGRARAATKAAERDAERAAWREANADAIAWATRAAARNTERGGTFDFPAKLIEALDKWGAWTDGQLHAVRKLMARDEVRKAESMDRQMRRNHPVEAGKIEAAFASARARAAREGAAGIWTHPLKLRASGHDLTFTPGSEGSRWAGMIFVREGETKLGAIQAGVFKPRFECTDPIKAAVIEACSDPAQAAVAFGKAWGVCSVCNRTLTNDESIARGIGPICAERFGW